MPPRDNLDQRGRSLFDAFGAASAGRPLDEVISAAMNVILNGIRQNTPRRTDAIARLSDLHGQAMSALLVHYDATTNRRRSVVAFDQVISANHVSFPSVIPALGRGGKNGSS